MIFPETNEGWTFHQQPAGADFDMRWMARHSDTTLVNFGKTKVEAAKNLAEMLTPELIHYWKGWSNLNCEG